MRTFTRSLTLIGLATSLGGCFVPMSGFGGGGSRSPGPAKPKTVPLAPVTYEELLGRTKAEAFGIGEINRDLTPVADLHLKVNEIDRINVLNKNVSQGGDLIGFFPASSLVFAGAKDGKLCWTWDDEVGARGDKRIRAEVQDKFDASLVQLHAVDDLGAIQGPITSEIPGGTQLAEVTLISTDLDSKDDRYAILETCAAMPAITPRTSHLVITVISRKPVPPTLEVTPYSEDLERDKASARFNGRAVLAWKLVGAGGPPAREDKPGKAADAPGHTGGKPGKGTDKPGKGSSLAGGAMKVARAAVAAGTPVKVEFDGPMRVLPGEKYWITIVDEAAGDTAYTAYKYLDPDASSIELTAPAVAGRYEVRLHGNYPTKTYNLLLRAKLTVK